jgi:hypothetical protein
VENYGAMERVLLFGANLKLNSIDIDYMRRLVAAAPSGGASITVHGWYDYHHMIELAALGGKASVYAIGSSKIDKGH